MNQIKILHTVGWLGLGGLEGGVIKLVNRLDHRRFIPYVAALRGFAPNVRCGLAGNVYFQAFQKSDGCDWRLIRELAKYFSAQKIDIVHSHNWDTFFYSCLAARLARVPVIIHGAHGRDTANVQDGWLKAQIISLLAWQCDRLTAVSQDLAVVMEQRWRAAPQKITVIPNGVDLAKFCPLTDRSATKAALGFDAKIFLVGTVVSSCRPVKDLPTLVDAFARAKRDFSFCKLVIVGGLNDAADEFAAIKQLAKNFGIERDVVFVGPQLHVEKYLKAFDLYANSSIYEGMCNALLEAMGCGAAIVATRVGGTPLIVREGENGLLVPAKSPAAMAEAMVQIMRSPALKERLVRNGRQYVEAHHSEERFITAHEQIYLEEYARKKQPKLVFNSRETTTCAESTVSP